MVQRENKQQDNNFKHNYIDSYVKCKQSKHSNSKAEAIRLDKKQEQQGVCDRNSLYVVSEGHGFVESIRMKKDITG